MSMRTDCKHYQRRTYSSGEAMEACDLDAAPDAPWRCPDDCALFERRTISRVGWEVGSLGPKPSESAPPLDAEAEAILAEVESIVNEAVPDAVRDLKKNKRRRRRK